MRKMMLVASVVSVSACGSVQQFAAGDDAEGDAGGGMTEPSTCNTAADCGAESACDVINHMCVAAALTMDSSNFIVEDGVWWTNTSGPTLHGTFKGATNATVQALVGGAGALAMQEGSSWTVTLPNGSIASSNTNVQISMTDPSGGRIEMEQLLGLDDAPPTVTLKPSTVRDESGDSIDFSTGQPVHSHIGTQIDLATSGCPTIHKYAYFMGASDPTYGQQTARNPLIWKFSIQDRRLDDASLAYRVIDPANTVVTDWTPLPSPTSVVYSVELNSANVASIASKPGNYHFEVRARDWGGRETRASYCWDNEILAAPLAIGTLSVPSDGLFSMSLPADSAISTLIDASTAVTVVETTITQYTAEPIRFAPQLESLDVQYSKRVFSGYVPVGTMEINSDFAGGSPVAPTITSSSGDLTNYATHMYLVAPDGSLMNADITGTYTIPGRAANQAPVAYTVRIQLGAVSELRPSASYAWGEFSTGSFTYTGDQVSDTIYGDCTTAIRCTRLECTCQAQVYKRIVALDAAHLDFAPMNVQLKTSPNENVALAAPSYAPSLSTGPMTWDAGDDDLGGY